MDATPLFLWLYGRCVESTGDLDFARELWPNVERAIEWIERWGDRDGDGYVKYMRETPRGLANQGWKDSADAISHHDGELAHPPIALAEVQGYVYAACTNVAPVATLSAIVRSRIGCSRSAATLKRSFERDFWLEHEGMIALALDGDEPPLPRDDVERRPLPCDWPDRRRARGRDVPSDCWPTICIPDGEFARSAQRAALQSDELSQRFGVAA